MRIAVMGTGAMGGYLGARLADAGADVTFIARGEHLAAMRKAGLKVTSPMGDLLIDPVCTTDDPSQVGPVDLVLLGVKLYDAETAIGALRPMLGKDTGVITLQNGVDAPDMVSSLAGPAHCVAGVAMINGEIVEPGVIQHNALNGLVVGELDGRPSERLRGLEELARKAGVEIEVSSDILLEIWRKFLALTPTAGLSVLTRVPLGQMRDTPETWALAEEAMAEVVAVAQAEGIGLNETDIKNGLDFIQGMPATWRGSLVMDLEQGKRLEVAWLHGAICRLGRRAGIDTPFHRVVLGALMPHADGAK
jgi:2-dehydropantoate 2-reductase